MIPLFCHKVKGVGQKSCKNYFVLRSLKFRRAARKGQLARRAPNLIWKIFMENFHKNIFDKTIDKSIY